MQRKVSVQRSKTYASCLYSVQVNVGSRLRQASLAPEENSDETAFVQTSAKWRFGTNYVPQVRCVFSMHTVRVFVRWKMMQFFFFS